MILSYSKEGLPIELDVSTAEIIYKENRVLFSLIKHAVDSGCDTCDITANLKFQAINGFVTFGCLELTNNQFNQLYRETWKLLKMYNKLGN